MDDVMTIGLGAMSERFPGFAPESGTQLPIAPFSFPAHFSPDPVA